MRDTFNDEFEGQPRTGRSVLSVSGIRSSTEIQSFCPTFPSHFLKRPTSRAPEFPETPIRFDDLYHHENGQAK